MKLKFPITCLVLLLFVPGCKKNENGKITEPPEGCINLSELLTKQDYFLPFALENDNNNVLLTMLDNETTDFSYGSFIEFKDNGFHELVLIYRDPQQENDTILFTTMTAEREPSEWGIGAWVPAIYETGTLGQENVEIYYPRRFTDLINVPLIIYVNEAGTVKPVYCEVINLASGNSFNIKRGVGSVNMAASSITNRVDFIIGGKRISATLARISETYMELKGIINSDVEIPANRLVRITGNLDIASTGSLTLHEGTLILVDEAVDINISGPVIFSGTPENPVTVTCSRSNKYWGGFITRVAEGTLEAHYTIFCQSGYHDTEGYYWGHSGRQALFYTENSTLALDHCFITDHIGQIFYPRNATITLDNILVQRAQTGGQVNFSELTLRNSVFTDFPDDSYDYADGDNDALYLTGSDAEIDNTVFMFAKDDGLDSGDPEGGEITVTNCRFEACFHEGAALSSGETVVKNHYFRDCVFTNCGQGLELGFSSPDHSVTAENCRFLNNGIGIRYGDNYEWSDVNGKMHIKNSLSLFNDKDVWNMVRMAWSPNLANLSFENTMVSQFCPQYPGLPVKEE